MGDMGLGTAFGAEGAADALRQIIKDRLAQQQQQFTNNRLTKNDQMTAELHQAQLASLQDTRAANAEKDKQSILTSITGRLTPGTMLNAKDSAPLPDYLKTSQPMQAPAAPDALAEGPQGGAMAGTVANSPAPQARNDIYTGTDKQKTDEEQKVLRGRLVMDPSLSPRERLMIGMENAGLKVPANMEAKPTFRQPVQVGPQGIFTDPADAIGKPGYHAPQQTATVTIQTVDGQGNPITKVVPKSEAMGKEFAARPSAQSLEHSRTNKETLDTLGQLDQAIENAKDLIGPGAGRISNLEQMAGSADPRIQALGVKMKAAKMRVDHAVTGSVRAGASPQMMQQWDNILANKVTPEGLKAGVQAMREILGGGAPAPSGGGSGIKSITEIK